MSIKTIFFLCILWCLCFSANVFSLSALNKDSPADADIINRLPDILKYYRGEIFVAFVVLLLFGIILFLLYRQRMISKFNARLLRAEHELKIKNEELHYLSGTDPLTGFFNRRAMEQFITDEMYRNKRYGQPVSLLIMDLDFFKKVNDSYGHSAGDRVLGKVSELVRSNIRLTDRAARWGGEEFLILSANTGLKGMLLLAEKLRKEFMLLKIDGAENITVSIGVAEYEKNEDFLDWYERADKSLYNAKAHGRNRVEFMESEHRVLKSDPVLKLVWKIEFLSGNSQIDRQHKEMFDQCNEIIEAFLSKTDGKRAHSLIENLYSKMAEHFRDEESVLKKCGYLGFEEHAKKHTELLNQFMLLKKALQVQEVDNFIFLEFLAKEVVLNHLVLEDKNFFSWLQ